MPVKEKTPPPLIRAANLSQCLLTSFFFLFFFFTVTDCARSEGGRGWKKLSPPIGAADRSQCLLTLFPGH